MTTVSSPNPLGFSTHKRPGKKYKQGSNENENVWPVPVDKQPISTEHESLVAKNTEFACHQE